ncbi:MAG: tRNA (N6-isopentenyl adenosine(37)-C2)-methylthiotransferase MiaB [Alphaproteobacteria bacterium]|nr:tRNA (N6-isopentenyl adenosine(37)-C2)-methylthiotransferase MiaB [Alphaproteobacteria bacterium]
MAKKLFIKTYGCQMNVYDSARMADVLAPLDYAAADGPEDADMVILNTCHIREKASEKLFSELGRLRRVKATRETEGRTLILAVAGCVAQAEGAEIFRRAPYVDLVFGPQAYHRLPEMVARATRAGGGVLDTDFPVESKFDYLPQASKESPVSAFLSIQEGCDKFCTFCVVPYTRGAEFSRPVSAVLEEAQGLVDAGAREITLLGQNVNAYHGEHPVGGRATLAGLIDVLAGIEGLLRIRYTTSHPRDMDDDLLALHGSEPKLMPFLHLPVQSGSDAVLERMNRGHRVEHYLERVARLRHHRPDIALSSDFIVGFPGETEADFEATLALVREVGFAQAFSFKFSPRPGTPAAMMEDQLPEAEKEERLARLQVLLTAQKQDWNAATVGRRLPVLFESAGRHPGQLVGRSPYLQAVHVESPGVAIGEVAEVVITALHANSLAGREVASSPAAAPDKGDATRPCV